MDAATSAVNKLLYGNSGKEAESQATPSAASASNDDVHDRTNEIASSGTGAKDTTVEREIAPAVEHETVKKEHETKEQTVIDRERHQHHYHTTVQPLKDQEVEATKHTHEQAATQERVIDKDNEGEQIKARVDAREGAFSDKTVEAATKEKTTDEGAVVGENVHHHLHETIQPVIQKGKSSKHYIKHRSTLTSITRNHRPLSNAQDHPSTRSHQRGHQGSRRHQEGAHLR